MAASMTLTITEDDAPDGFEVEDARVNGDLPPAVLLGARLLEVIEQELPSHGGRVAPPPHGTLPTRSRR